MKTILTTLLLAIAPWILRAAPEVHTPPPGSDERAAIMDALRGPVKKELKQDVVFKVDALKVKGSWAFLKGVPQKPNGKPIDYSKTEYKTALAAGAFEDWVCALLKRSEGEWKVVEYAIGATDVPWVSWAEDHGAPKVIFE